MRNKSILFIFILSVWVFLFYYKEESTNFIVFNWLGMPYESNLSNTLWFFINTIQKILYLLILVIFVSGVVRSYFSPEKTRKYLEGKSLFVGNVLASLLGIVTPFCSCSAIPLFLGFVETGIPLGVTFSFLIAAPMINEVAVFMLFSLFGWEVGIIYMLTGLFIAIVSGWTIGKLKLEKWLQDWVVDLKHTSQEGHPEILSFNDRLQIGQEAVGDILSKVWLYILFGIGVGAFVHGYVPDDSLASLINKTTWYSVPLAVLVGIPLYSCSAGAVPIAYALIEKGVPLGTALAFMMSVIGISLPELIILKKVLKLQFILIFIGILAFGITFVGYLMNLLL